MCPTVSIIVPVYNVAPYLRRCVDSILAQTFQDFELLLVDDGSTDGSGGICEEYAARDGRVRVIRKENGGASSARNAGLDHAVGKYLMYIDGDDRIEADMVESQYRLAEYYGADIVCCGFFKDDEGDGASAKQPGQSARIYTWEENAKYLLQGDLLFTSLCNKLYRDTLKPYIRSNCEISFTEDLLANYHAVKNAACFVMNPKPLYHYLVRKTSQVQNSLNEGQFSALKVSAYLMKAERDNPELLPYCRRQKDIIVMSLITRIIKANRFWERYPELRRTLLADYRDIMRSGLYTRKERMTAWMLKYCPGIYRAVVVAVIRRQQHRQRREVSK